jgi:general nucleoside transport system permease protein
VIKIENRRTVQISTVIWVSILSVLISLLISIIILQLMHYKPIEVFSKVFGKTYFRLDGILENLLLLIPISLCALAVIIPAKAGFWNIGAEGQFYMGAIGATGIALAFPYLPRPILIPLMLISGIILSGLVVFICTIPKIKWGVSEFLTTVLSNSIIIYFVKFLVYDAWKDHKTLAAQTPEFVNAAKIPILIPGSRLHYGFILAILIVLGINFILKRTIFGYELRLTGANRRGAEYAGIDTKKYAYFSMIIGGALAGIAGVLEVSGVVFRLQPTISADYGFSAVVIAWISRLNPIAMLFVGYMFSGLLVANFKMQMMGLPSSITGMLKGLILLFIVAGELLTFYKFSWVRKKGKVTKIKKKEKVEVLNQNNKINFKKQYEGGE